MRAVSVPWAAEPHTKTKHDLYRRYLSKWMPIMINGRWNGDVTYAEGFAGPGIYLDDSPGSPVIAFNAIREDPSLRSNRRKHVRMLFVDADRRCTDRLWSELTRASAPVALDALPQFGIEIDVQHGTCEPRLVELLDAHACWGRPILAVLDTWGGAVPLGLVGRIAANPSSEVLITIEPQFFSRFATAEEVTHGDAVFGGTQWRDVANQPPERKTRWLIEHYRDTVQRTGFKYVLDFELVDSRGASLYLVFGTSHQRGLEKMKEAMWEVDPEFGSGYRDPRDPNQETLDIQPMPQTQALQRLLISNLETRPGRRASVMELRQFAFFQTIYKASQVPPVVDDMANRGRLSVERVVGRFNTVVRLN